LKGFLSKNTSGILFTDAAAMRHTPGDHTIIVFLNCGPQYLPIQSLTVVVAADIVVLFNSTIASFFPDLFVRASTPGVVPLQRRSVYATPSRQRTPISVRAEFNLGVWCVAELGPRDSRQSERSMERSKGQE
jgi:hypothetical protein